MTFKPKYIIIADQIEQDILLHKYQDQLPQEQELAIIYQTSKVTIAKAISFLQYQGVVKAVKGHGTYILAGEDIEISTVDDATLHGGFTSRMQNTHSLSSHVISFDIRCPTEEEIVRLKLKKNDQVYDIIRQRKLQDFPVRLEYTVMPVKVIPGVDRKVLQNSIYGYIKNTLKLKIGKANRTFRADKSDAYDQLYLKCLPADPVFEVEQIAFLADNVPFEFSQTRSRYDQYKLILNQV